MSAKFWFCVTLFLLFIFSSSFSNNNNYSRRSSNYSSDKASENYYRSIGFSGKRIRKRAVETEKALEFLMSDR